MEGQLLCTLEWKCCKSLVMEVQVLTASLWQVTGDFVQLLRGLVADPGVLEGGFVVRCVLEMQLEHQGDVLVIEPLVHDATGCQMLVPLA